LVFSVPIGVLGAVYLVEYQGKSRFAKGVWIIVHNLAGVPSIVYGLLGLGLLVAYLQLDLGILVAGITLGLLVLPVIIVTTREALIAVPPTVREASLAVGATKWQTIRHHVIPYAMPGILTGMILSLSRAAGETAPILALGATALAPGMPSLFGPYMALPYHIYIMSSQSTNAALTAPIQYASALVLLIIVIGMNLFAIYLRKKYRDKYRW
jgi:phosphate transport system permease protein